MDRSCLGDGIVLIPSVKGGEKVDRWGVAVQDTCPSKWPAEMSLGQVAMVSDGDVAGAARSCRVGGPSASR